MTQPSIYAILHNMKNYIEYLSDEQAMLTFGGRLAGAFLPSATLFLYGNLGAGKTTLSRGFLHSLGHTGKVKSPTYTLVEPYQIADQTIYHFDLYRIHDPEELALIGIDEYFATAAIRLVEWPEQGSGVLPQPDLSCYIEPQQEGRQVRLVAETAHGVTILTKFINRKEDPNDNKKTPFST